MAICVWLTGPRGAGKSTIGRGVVDELRRAGHAVVLLDDAERAHLVDGPAAVGWLLRTLTGAGVSVVVAADLPARRDRDHVRAEIASFTEVFVDAGDRGPGTGVDYEEPFGPELRVPTDDRDPAASTAFVVSWLEHTGRLEGGRQG